jgi:hypothetical protein
MPATAIEMEVIAMRRIEVRPDDVREIGFAAPEAPVDRT